MARAAKHARVKRLYCTTCRKEVPSSEANVAEARDSFVHFCGLECFDQWWKRSHHPQQQKAAPQHSAPRG